MMRVAGSAACLVVAACAGPLARPVAYPRGQMIHLRLPSPALHDSARSVRVYLPPSYRLPESAQRRYPVVYLLHGWPGGDGNWPGHGRAAVTLDSLIAKRRMPEVIAVMPNGNGIGLVGRSLYLNSWDGRSNMADFVERDLVGWADRTFRTLPDSSHRAIIGLSDGGSAALNLAFHHPEVFGACAGLSGQYRLVHDLGLHHVLGPEPGATRILTENSPVLYASRMVPRLRAMTIYLDCGLKDPDLRSGREMHRTLERLGVPHLYLESAGRHGWGFWKRQLAGALVACTAGMR